MQNGKLGRRCIMAKIKVISLVQPWAYLFALGAKKFETRSWQTKYRGELYIHSSAKFHFSDLELCRESEHFKKYIPDPSSGILVTGAIIGKVNLVDIVTTESIRETLPAEERAFGDYRDGRYAWKCEGAMLLPEPIQAKGKLSIWEYEMKDELEEFDPDYIGPDPEDDEPDLNGPTQGEFAERMHYYQRYLK